ncbi:epoxide hydrolase family protein [Microbacterium sp. W4I20]|uniref:epoxide hydrolase family protein n=1 Tax=Microbacterium sp. W4I20 TaxID=3042262 RepID=UPI0027842916|nr:epoxide hydrolase [Microbacterium sp. W4I20]MDQ0727844.1 pimeloyl-ACP methyl ester carboxylesterase [Microbacterium sp. W4I20]
MTNDTRSIRPFRIEVSDEAIADLHQRITLTRWPRDLGGTGWDRGIPTSYLRPLAEYWRDRFDWRKQEAHLNELPHYVTEVDAQQIHFVHVRSEVPGARPLLLLHGWPSSFVEFVDLIGPLTDPVAHGGKAEDAVHVVIPSLPGYGFSPLADAGWGDLLRVAGAMAEVMGRLGYERFLAHGTDVGSGIVGMLPMVAPGRIIATHVNGPSPFPLGPALPVDALPEGEQARAARFNTFRDDGAGYLHIQATRPQTVAYGLNDSPVAQLAWIVEKFREWTDPAAALPEDAVDIDRLLTTVSIFWFTQSGWSSAHALYEGMQVYRQFAAMADAAASGEGAEHAGDDGYAEADTAASGGWEAPPAPPAAASIFAADLSVRSVVDPASAFESWTEHDSGGHFPALEVPEILVADMRRFFDGHR